MSVVDDLLDELLTVATDLATAAAALLLDGLTRHRVEVSTKSSPTDMVTEMDRASEALIVAGIRAARPDDGIVGEEGADLQGSSGVRWLVDPVDGTTNYLYGFPGETVADYETHFADGEAAGRTATSSAPPRAAGRRATTR